MSRVPVEPFWKPAVKEPAKVPEVEACSECYHWERWKNCFSLGYRSRASSKPCKQAIPRRS